MDWVSGSGSAMFDYVVLSDPPNLKNSDPEQTFLTCKNPDSRYQNGPKMYFLDGANRIQETTDLGWDILYSFVDLIYNTVGR